jgi:4-carboxymuconolactone decarboxylase
MAVTPLNDIGDDRLPPLGPQAMTLEQAQAVSALVKGPRGTLQGPFIPMLRSPGFMNRAQKVGEYIRYESPLPALLRELAILVTARCWGQTTEWHIHAPIARAAGLASDDMAAIANDVAPEGLDEAGMAVYRFCLELHLTQGVTDDAYAAALDALGEVQLIDLTGLCGYYAMLAMVMNVARTPLPAGVNPFEIPD